MKRSIKYIFVLAALLVGASNVFAQKEKAAYKSFKLSTRSDASQLLREADDLKTTNSKEALNKVQDALAISIADEDHFNEGKSYVLLGEINLNIQEWKLALENFNQANDKLEKEFSNTAEFKRTVLGRGKANLELGNYDAAKQDYEKALTLKLSRTEKQDVKLAVSEVYYRMKKYDDASKVLDDIAPSSSFDKGGAPPRVQNQRAKISARTYDANTSVNQFNNSLNTLRSEKKIAPEEEIALQDSKEEIASALHEQKNYDAEIAVREQSAQYYLDNNNFPEVTKDKVAISKSLEAKGETTRALKELEEAATIADTIQQPKVKETAYRALAEAYTKAGRKEDALAIYKKYSEAVEENEKQSNQHLAEKSSLIRKQNEINEYASDISIGRREATIEQQTMYRQQLIIYGLLFIIAIIVVTSYFIYKNARASKIANQLLALKSLRGQMNPHFIFNALNSVNHFISQQDERTANKFLSEFSQLMRLVLENSQEDFIPLYKELEILTLYLKLEHYRFRDKFEYDINIDGSINTENITVPPMLIQPYIENAVWHGLRYKETSGKLSMTMQRQNGHIVVDIDDDGIGRKRSAELKTQNQKKHNSTGLKNIEERLSIIRKVYHADYKVEVRDGEEGKGTHVRIYLPVDNHK